jgi:dipeptidyl aminopeptidase/acylaminoacyl peptidase
MITGSSLGLPDRVQVDESSGAAAVAIASTGVRAALDAPSESPAWQFLSLTDGRPDTKPGGLNGLDDVTVSPDGRRAVGIERYGSRADLWVVDLVRAVRTRLAAGPRLVSPAWSPDGGRVAFAASDGGPFHVLTTSADGGGAAEGLGPSDAGSVFPSGWTPDGTSIVLTRVDQQRGLDLGWAPSSPVRGGLAGSTSGVVGTATGPVPEGPSRTLPDRSQKLAWDMMVTPADEGHGVVSPGGRWIAYETNDAGRWGIAIRPTSEPGPVIVVAAEGRQPAWADDRALVYLDGDRLMRVATRDGVSYDPQPPVVVATGVVRLARGVVAGGRVLAQTGLTTSRPDVTLEWFDELKSRLEASQPPPRSFR